MRRLQAALGILVACCPAAAAVPVDAGASLEGPGPDESLVCVGYTDQTHPQRCGIVNVHRCASPSWCACLLADDLVDPCDPPP